METFKTQNYPELLERIDPDIWKRAPNTPIKSTVLPMLETIIFNSDSRIKLAVIISLSLNIFI